MNGLRAAGLGAGGAVLIGSFAATLVSSYSAERKPASAGGATFVVVDRRLVVTSLRTGGAEGAAGLQVGDMIEAANGIPRPTLRALTQAENYGVVSLRVRRHGDVIPVTLLQPRPGGPT
ncbi:hypothetical protein ASG67_05950 [Sphingomonas sp. Leaf339]|uniref:hypothetical protein n=1 Tax=Sphingomonas sp. Leaf339 TaxID=1736343 RepID=UPI0006F997BD|nr:hypothetical protein [Sphingomonas sp. Leaf339]KQU55678.1 hypothetical protein ASG67_05950 [Sphingomonas sp. Leaf339]